MIVLPMLLSSMPSITVLHAMLQLLGMQPSEDVLLVLQDSSLIQLTSDVIAQPALLS